MTRASEGASAATSRPSTLPDAVGTGLSSVVGAGIFVALGTQVADARTGDVLYSDDAAKPVMPASRSP